MRTSKTALSLFSLLFLAFVGSITAQTRLNRVEKQIVKQVSSNHNEAIGFLEQVVNVNSGTLNLEGVREAGRLFEEQFQSIAFETLWEEMPAEMNRAGHLIAKIEGS